jgi:hypothetical protein
LEYFMMRVTHSRHPVGFAAMLFLALISANTAVGDQLQAGAAKVDPLFPWTWGALLPARR